MAPIEFVFKSIPYESQTVELKASVHLPQDAAIVKGIGEFKPRTILHQNVFAEQS
jgi:hypothetical protein